MMKYARIDNSVVKMTDEDYEIYLASLQPEEPEVEETV